MFCLSFLGHASVAFNYTFVQHAIHVLLVSVYCLYLLLHLWIHKLYLCIFSSLFPLELYTNVTKLLYPVLFIFTTVAFHFLVYIDVFSMHQVRNYSPPPSINNSIKVSAVIYDLCGKLCAFAAASSCLCKDHEQCLLVYHI